MRTRLETRSQTRTHEIDINSWHYRLTRFGLGPLANQIKRGCPYWMILVPVSTLSAVVRVVVSVIWILFLSFGYYPWLVFVWLCGYKPRYWRGLYKVWDTREKYLMTNREMESGWGGSIRANDAYWSAKSFISRAFPFVVLALVLSETVFVFGLGEGQVQDAVSVQWYYLPLMAYAVVVFPIALVNAWRFGPWPYVKLVYCALCPQIVYVERAAETAKPENGKQAQLNT